VAEKTGHVRAALRAAVAPRAEPLPDKGALMDWFSLNEALGEGHASLDWFDGARSHAR